jgi:hypothetical protein
MMSLHEWAMKEMELHIVDVRKIIVQNIQLHLLASMILRKLYYISRTWSTGLTKLSCNVLGSRKEHPPPLDAHIIEAMGH